MIIRYVTMGLPKGPHKGVVCDWPIDRHEKHFALDDIVPLPLTACIWLVPGTFD